MEVTIKILQVVAWPLCIATSIVIGLLIFKSTINGLIDRAHNVGVGALRIDTSPPKTQEVPKLNPSTEKPTDHVDEVIVQAKSYQTVLAIAQNIKSELPTSGYEVKTKTEEALVLMVALLSMQRKFEWAYGSMYGSQIALLRGLVERNSGYSKSWLDGYITDVKERSGEPLKSMSHATYMQWLVFHELVQVADDVITITKSGEDFLRWMVEQRRSSNRPF